MHEQYEQNKIFSRQMNENSVILKNINDQLGELNKEISKLQTRHFNTEACISNISQTQATLINRMAAKPELVAPTETDAFAVLKAADTPVASINIDGDYKSLNRYECPTDPKIVDKILACFKRIMENWKNWIV